MNRLYLSRRNLLVLLSKLDRKAAGQQTQCTIIKYSDYNTVPKYPNTEDTAVTAVEDADYYSIDNPPGVMHPADEPISPEKEV